MAVMFLPAPDTREGARLKASIEEATGYDAEVSVVGDEWQIVTDADEEAVRALVDAHDGTPGPTPPSIADQIDALPDPTVDFDGFRSGLKALLGAE